MAYKINIASNGGRTHMLDTARELAAQGFDVKFYSYVPKKRCLKYGLPKECVVSYYNYAIPFLLVWKIFRSSWYSLYFLHRFIDFWVGHTMRPCDIFIAQSPAHVSSIKRAKKKYGSKIILERGTSHVLTQIKALKSNPANIGKDVMPKMFLKRDLEGYKLADYISVASDHVVHSFLDNGINPTKMFKNPYGVNLKNFGPTELLSEGVIYDVLMVGQWCHRKGCDLLYQACKELNIRLLHVGTIVDVPFVQTENFKHYDAVDEQKLKEFYSRARIFALPSREEGLALVQPQAVICGLPLVCSNFSGGKDIRDMLDEDNKKWIIVMKEYSLACLKQDIISALSLANQQRGLRNYAGCMAEKLTWKAYGKRYKNFILNIND